MKGLGIIILLLNIFGLLFPVKAQQQAIFRTQHGTIAWVAIVSDTVAIAMSDKLVATFNHQSGEVILKLNMRTLRSTNPKINEFYHQFNPGEWTFQGQSNLYLLQPNDRTKQPLNIKGYLSIDGRQTPLEVTGLLIPNLSSGQPTYVLSLDFDIQLSDLGLEEQFPGFYDFIHIEIAQTMMKPSP